jgi:hypothetical protein
VSWASTGACLPASQDVGCRTSSHQQRRATPPVTKWMRRAAVHEDVCTRTCSGQRIPAQGRGLAFGRPSRTSRHARQLPWTSRRAALWPREPNRRPCLRAATPECLVHFDEHLVCGDAGEAFESVNPGGVQGSNLDFSV